MKNLKAALAIAACLMLPIAGAAFATGQPGSPKVSCGGTGTSGVTTVQPPPPGNMTSSTKSSGSPFGAAAFTPSGSTSTNHYAGGSLSPSTNASQYDIACAKSQQVH